MEMRENRDNLYFKILIFLIEIESNQIVLPSYIRTGFRVYTLLVLHYYNTLMYLCSADTFKT